MLSSSVLSLLPLLYTPSLASPLATQAPAQTLSNAASSLTLLYQNNLNASDDINHVGAILLDPMTQKAGAAACATLGESLLPQSTIQAYSNDFYHSLAYVVYSAGGLPLETFYTANGTVEVSDLFQELKYLPNIGLLDDLIRLPVLCTQSSHSNSASNSAASAANAISVASSGNTFVGFRNQKSFRFQGIPYTNTPARFTYSSVYNQTGQTIQATTYGPDCSQAYDGSSQENCLFLNIQTPYIPKAGFQANLRPVLVSIYGGGFTGGNGGPSSGLDGGNLASRHDIVAVEFNYRLSTLGFLAIPGTDILGNFGIGDQITALRWVKANIASFGGDPNQVTIIGESAGAGSVRALLGSPPAIEEKLFHGAISQSNLGGGATLGLQAQYSYANTYSSYLTVQQSYNRAGQAIFTEAGCTQPTSDEQIACLKTVPATTIVNLPTVARYVVQDGTIVNTEQLDVTNKNGSTAFVNVIFGTTNNDGASFSTLPPATITSEQQGIQSALGISAQYAESIINSGLFPFYNTGNLQIDAFNVSQRVATDYQFRCIDEATVYAGTTSGAFKSAYYYNIDRTYAGYDPNNLASFGLASGPVEPGYPNGDPELPYFRLHGSDLGFTYGNQNPLRDVNDLQASQLISGYYVQFVKTGNPNPSTQYLTVRGYTEALAAVQASGPWSPVNGATGPAKQLDYVSPTIAFPELDQCKFLNYSISYYIDGGN